MKRYLFYLSYIGTQFRGIQKNRALGTKDKSIETYLEESLFSLNPSNKPSLSFSSRTDAGVHSLGSTFSSVLCLPPMNIRPPDTTIEEYITECLNEYFFKLNLDIRIFRTEIVPLNFHCRKSIEKKVYLYRVAHLSEKNDHQSLKYHLPLTELNQCFLIKGDINFTAINCACEILEGQHDFRYFVKKAPNERRVLQTVRTLNELKISPGQPLFPTKYCNHYENLRFWNIIVSSSGFLYNQIRRIVGVLLSVGKGKLSLEEVTSMIEEPRQPFNSKAFLAPPDGLFLIKSQFNPAVFRNLN